MTRIAFSILFRATAFGQSHAQLPAGTASAAEVAAKVDDLFQASVGTIRFTRDSRNRVPGCILNSRSIRNFRFARQTP